MPCKFHFPLFVLWECKNKEKKADIHTFIQTLHPNLKP